MSTGLEEKITSSLVDNRLPCAAAFEIAREMKINRQEVGDAANRLRIRITNCQLGFFTKEKATHADLAGKEIDRALVEEINISLDDGRLTCPRAFGIAQRLKVTPKEVGDTATLLGINVKNCQLGLFP